MRNAYPVGLTQVTGGSGAIRLWPGSRGTIRAQAGTSCVDAESGSVVAVKLRLTVTSDALFVQVSYSSPARVRMRITAVSRMLTGGGRVGQPVVRGA